MIDLEKFYEASGLYGNNNLAIAIRGEDGSGERGQVFFGQTQVFNNTPVTTTVTLPQGNWQLAATPVNGWANSAPNAVVTRFWLTLIGLLIWGAVYSGGLTISKNTR